MTTLVTGGLGFVGRYIIQDIATKGEKVVSYNRDFSQSSDSNVVTVQGELYDIPRLLETFNRYGVVRIIHTAAMSHPDLSIELPITTVTANIDGSIHLFEAARIAGIRRIVNLSSECAYGHHEGPITEDIPLNPATPYAVTKASVEQFATVYNNLYGMNIISLRVSEVYGPGNKMPQILYDMLRAGLNNQPYHLPQGGDHKFQFVYVLDVARAAVCAANCKDNTHSVFNITGGEQVSIISASRIVNNILPGAELHVGGGIMERDIQGQFDIHLAKRDIGYEPEWTLEKGLRSYAEWLRGNPY